MLTLISAYNRVYTNQKQIKEDWALGKDFMVSSSRQYINRQDALNSGMDAVIIRYGKQNEKVMTLKCNYAGSSVKTKKASKGKVSFEAWMQKVDAAIASKLMGMTSGDLADMCYYDYWKSGKSPAAMAKLAVSNEFGY